MPLTFTLQDEILSDIETVAKDEKLLKEENFQLRSEALDHIEYHILDRIESLLKNGETKSRLQTLKQHAERLRLQLEETNARTFQKLRSKISDGSCRGKVFMDLIEKYFPLETAGFTGQQTIGYDHLDLFMNGVLSYRKPPAESRQREPEMVYYQKTPGRIILEIIRRAAFIPNDIFVDLGSGLGQVVLLVNILAGITARGVEYDPAFCDYARARAADLNLDKVEFINTDARYADCSSGTVFFMYTPFEGKMFRDVMDCLRAEAKKRTIKLFGYGTCTADLAKQDWFIRKNKSQFGPGALGEFLSY